MIRPRHALRSEYMHWAKTHAGVSFNLAVSGVSDLSLEDLGAKPEDVCPNGPAGYGYEPLLKAVALACGAPVECVFTATGTSLANHLAMAAVLEPGDEVAIEHPTYELLLTTAQYLGARITRFPRRFQDGFALDLGEVSRAVSSGVKLIILTNLHNPSGALMPPEVLREVGQMAQRAGAFVLVDEVYLDATCDQTPRTAFLLGDEFIVTNSLTKVYGLSGLRCGWVLAKPELVERMWRLKDLFGVNEAHPAERLSVVAFSRLAEIRARMLALLDQNRLVFEDFLAGRDDLEVSCPPCGTVAFPRVRAGRVDELCELLRAEYATSVVPGRFFEMDDHIRIGLCASTGTLTAGLERLGAALDRHRA